MANYDHDYECLKSDAVVNACKQVAQTAPVSLESHKWEDTAHNMPESNKLEALEKSVRDTVDRDESYVSCTSSNAMNNSSNSRSEYITEDMFRQFISANDKSMENIRSSLKSFTNMFFIEDEEGVEHYMDEKVTTDQGIARKRASTPILDSPILKRSKIENKSSSAASATVASASEKPDHINQSMQMNNTQTVLPNSDTSAQPHLSVNIHRNTSENDVLTLAVDDYIIEKKMAPAVRTDLAQLLNKMLINKMDDSKRNALYEKHLRQENCELNFPRVNVFI